MYYLPVQLLARGSDIKNQKITGYPHPEDLAKFPAVPVPKRGQAAFRASFQASI